MWKHRMVGVVVPALNEEANIARTVSTIPDFVDKIIVVDDGSTDRTSQEAETCKRDAIILRNERPTGVGGAIIAGHKRALAEGADMVAVMAGDGQMPPEFLPLFADAIASGYDYAKGNRFMRQGDLEGMSLLRIVGDGYMSALIRLATGLKVFDSHNGYTMISASALRRLDFDTIERGFFFENSMLFALAKMGARVVDIPCSIRASAKSNVNEIMLLADLPGFFLRRMS